ncbi:MAG: M24 family metallopeptidase, partial [Acidimicrobiia bacterium]|nr:M24 family metallopeptidase [Acidimicrobiia bacterium]
MNHDKRLQSLRSRLEFPLLVTDLANIRYLSGFTGSSAYLLVTPDGGTFFTDGRYGEVAGVVVAGLEGVDLHIHTGPVVDDIAARSDNGPLGLEGHHVTWDFVRRLEKVSPGEIAPTDGLVSDLRRYKDADEVEALRTAAAAGDAAFARVTELVERAATEGDLGRALIEVMEGEGAERAGWEPIVAAGANASLPHHRAGSASITDGLILFDYGCIVDGYNSDMSRTIWVG